MAERLISEGWNFDFKLVSGATNGLDQAVLTKPADFRPSNTKWRDLALAVLEDVRKSLKEQGRSVQKHLWESVAKLESYFASLR